MTESFSKAIFLVNLVATLFMCGVIWFVQVVHYPLFARVGAAGYSEYQAAHQTLTTFVVMPPMLVEMGTAWLLLVYRPPQVPLWVTVSGVLLVLGIWLATFFLSVPQHALLSLGFDAAAHERLVSTNWLRTLAWTLRAVLLLYGTALLLFSHSETA